MPTATADPPHYELLLLGPPLIRAAGREPVLRRKTRLLLVYLAASRRAHTRGELLRLFCPEAADPRATLRNLLSRVRRKVGATVLVTDEDRVRFNDAVAEIDVPRFAAVLSAPERRSLEELRSALDLYRGQFAADLEADDLPEVALWLLSTRTGLQNLYERGLSELLARLTAARAFPAAIEAAQRLLLINPLHEMAHGRLIQLYATAGQVEAAQIQYQRCRQLLATELAVSPSPELEALATAALQGSGATHVQLAPPPALKDRVTPLVGRSAALSALEEALYSARSGRGRVVLLEGEPGTGKSYLAHTFARRQQLALLQGSAYEVESAVAFGPWREVIEARAALLSDVELRRLPFYVQQALRRLVPGLGAHLRGALPTGAQLQPDNLHYALSDFLLQPQAEQLPLVALFIDNLQWADHASLHLFHFLARRVAAQPLLLLGAWHPPARHDPPEVARLRAELDRLHPIVIALQPLDETDIGALLEQQRNDLGAEGRAVLARRVWQATGGNAFFASEVVRELDGRQELPEQMPLPDSIRTLFSRRAHALPAGQRQVIEAVAIMTETTRAVVTQQVGGRSEEETLLALDAGLGQRLLVEVELDEGLGYDIVHELARRTILEEMSGARRRALHRRAARALSALGAPWARVAHHWRAAGDAAAELHALHRAIAEAQAVFANEELVQLLMRALALETEPAAGWALRFELAAVAQRTGRWEEGLAQYDHVAAAAQTAGLTGWLARSNLQRGKLLLNQGQYDEASGALAAAQTAFDAAPEAGAAYLHAVAAEQAHLLFRRGEMAAAEKLAETTAAAARAAGAAEAELRALSALSSVLGQTGRFDPALEHLRRQRELARELGNPTAEATVLTEMGHVAYFHGQLGLSEELLEASLAVHKRCGNLIGVARVEGNLGLVYAHQGDLVRAISRTKRGLAMSEALAHKPNIAVHVGNLSFMYTMRNEFDAALASLSRALELDEELGHPEAVARHLGNRGTTYYHMGRDEQALADFERSLHAFRQLSHRAGESSILGDLGLLYGRRGDDEEALSYILAALAIDLELEARDGCARHLGNLARVLLRRGRLAPARAACLRAVALEKEIGARRMLASDLETLATAEALLGNREGAGDLARESVAVSLEVERVDSEIGARCLLIRLRSAAGELTPAAAAELLALLERSDDPRARARIWDVLFEAAPDHPALIDAPAALADAYAKQPAVWLRETHFRLTGRYLPAPPALTPDSQSPDPPALETLLPRVDALLDDSPLPGA